MSEEISPPEENLTSKAILPKKFPKLRKKEKSTKERVGYGMRIPYLTLENAVRIIKEVATKGGTNGSMDALSEATGNSTGSSSFAYKISALKGFKLLAIEDGGYALSEIGNRIVQPEPEEDEYRAICDAFTQQETLNKTWEAFKGKILPQRDHLAAYLGRQFKIPSSLQLEWADYFIESARFAGLLRDNPKNGSINVQFGPSAPKKADGETTNGAVVETKPEVKRSEIQIEGLVKNPGLPTIQVVEGNHWGILSQRRLSGNRSSIIAIPDELLQEDIDVLRQILKGIDVQLDGLKKYE